MEGPPPPSPLTELTVLEITSTSFAISLRPSQGHVENGNTIHCLINVTDMEGRNVVFHNNANCTNPELTVPELSPDHVYQVVVTAVLGERVRPSMALVVKTRPIVPGMYIHKHIYPIIYKIDSPTSQLHKTVFNIPYSY